MTYFSRIERLKKFFKNRNWVKHTVVSIILYALSFLLMYYTALWRERIETTTVDDLIVDALPTIHLDTYFVILMYFLCLLMYLGMLYYNPERLPFLFKALAVLFLVRSFAIPLTHIGPPQGFILDGASDPIFGDYYFTKDLFFSGHTAFLFIGFLLHKKRWVRMTLLAGSIIIPLMLLLMHTHYSFDILAAYFIAYGVCAISKRLFKQEIE